MQTDPEKCVKCGRPSAEDDLCDECLDEMIAKVISMELKPQEEDVVDQLEEVANRFGDWENVRPVVVLEAVANRMKRHSDGQLSPSWVRLCQAFMRYTDERLHEKRKAEANEA